MLKTEETKVLHDPTHGYIHVDPKVVWGCIDAKEMQRLRRIHQLGKDFQVYHTAEHSRLSHFLGVYEVVRRMVYEVDQLWEVLSDYEKAVVVLAGLLYDIRHGSFFHAFEGISTYKHEGYTAKITVENNEVHQILAACDARPPEDVASIIQYHHAEECMDQLVSGQLDVDRTDYLLQDAYFTGASYGKSDLERILRTTRVKNRRIVVKTSGIYNVEGYIMARYRIYWQVYLHPVTRSYETLPSILFCKMKGVYALHPEYLSDVEMFHPFLCGADAGTDALYRLGESAALYGFPELVTCRNEILRNISYRFLNRKLLEYATLKNPEDLECTQLHVQALGYDPDYYVYQDVVSQKPYSPYKSNESGHNVWVLEESGKIKELLKASDIVRALARADLKEESKLYFPEEKLHIKQPS